MQRALSKSNANLIINMYFIILIKLKNVLHTSFVYKKIRTP